MSGHVTRGGMGPEYWTDDLAERDDEAIWRAWMGGFNLVVLSTLAVMLKSAIAEADAEVICDSVSADDLQDAEVELREAMLRLLEDIENQMEVTHE